MPSSLTSAFQIALSQQAAAALVEVVASQPRTTVGDLASLVGANPSLGALTLDQLLGGVGSSPAKRGRGRPKGSKSAATKAKPGRPKQSVSKVAGGLRDVRTQAGRDHFHEEVRAALRQAGGRNVAANTMRDILGGADPHQLRAALNRMIENGEVTYSGRAKGTRYSVG